MRSCRSAYAIDVLFFTGASTIGHLELRDGSWAETLLVSSECLQLSLLLACRKSPHPLDASLVRELRKRQGGSIVLL